ncbi:hypothetical protein VNO77_32813 [Canavalia gladiata]|uniref:Uncharacterized protein n=1 Tax=Canavalia gladiata TaxID=3824 RepID=A0AAN9Q4E2_CANGL
MKRQSSSINALSLEKIMMSWNGDGKGVVNKRQQGGWPLKLRRCAGVCCMYMYYASRWSVLYVYVLCISQAANGKCILNLVQESWPEDAGFGGNDESSTLQHLG